MKNLLRFLILFVSLVAFPKFQSVAQTTLVDPNGAGGFELGADMASNGWTEVNSVQSFFVGNPPVQATGNNCAYTSTVNGSWTPGTAGSVAHIYRDITIPAGESKLTLSLKYKTFAVDAGWDFLKVHLVPTSTIPVAGTQLATGQLGANTDGTTAYATYNFITAVTPGTTYRLVISFRQDGVAPYGAAALDDISAVSAPAGNFISIITGNWNDPLTWDANAVPTAADNATVSTGHVVTVNAAGQGINNLIVNGTLAYAAAPTQFNVNGNLTVNNGGLVNAFNGTTGKTLFVAGNIVNDGTLNFSVGGAGNSATGAAILTLNGSLVQTVSGSGSFLNNKIGSLVCSNTSTATPNITWQFNNIIVQHTLNLSNARFNLGTLTMSHGSSFNTTTGSMTLTTTAGCGFMPGAKYRRWYTTGATGSTISAGFDPTATTSRFPFINAAGTNQRWVHINRSSATTTGNTAGYLAVVYNDATTMTTGLSVLDGTYTVTDRYDGNWTISAEGGYVYASGLHRLAISANGAYPPLNGNTRIMLANAPMGGNHQNGTATPTGQRIDLSTAQLTAGTLYLGIASADNQYPCVGTPNIPEALATTPASVCPNGTVTMNATGLTTGFIGITNQWQVSSVSGGPYTNVVGGTGATTATHTTAPITTPGTYYYVLAHTCTNSGVTSLSNEVVVTVNPLPTVTATAANSGNFCGVGTLTASGASTYSWSPAASLLSNTGATVTSIATTNTTFTVTGTDANGCVNTATAAITYTAPPAITVTATTPSFCGTGGNSTLTATSAGNYSYVWEALDGATLSTTTGNTTTATVTQTSSVRVTGTETATGCVEIQNYSIGVYPLPSATVTTTADGVCPGTSATINSGLSAGNFTVTSIAHTPFTAPGSAGVLMNNGVATTPLSGGSMDDGGWGNIPIGFSFNFFGTSFSSLAAGTNGLLMFGAVPGYGTGAGQLGQFNFSQNASTCTPPGAATGQYFPNCNNPGNIIALLAADMQMANSTNGSIKYWNEGYAPNRKFIIQYRRVHGWSNNPEATVTCVLYETLGIVDIFIDNKTFSNTAIVGLQDATKTIGAVAPGRAGAWTTTVPEAWRFAPPSNYTTIWTANGTEIANGTNIFSQSVAPAVTTTYSISYTNQTTGCANAPGSAQVTMQVLGTVAPNNVTAQASVVNACSGVTFNLTTNYTGLTDGLTYQWQSSPDGTTWSDITGATTLTYTTSLTAATSYRIGISSCGGTITYSAPVSVGLAPPTQCYCTPTATYGCADGDVIARVILNTLDNNSGTGCPSDPDPTDPSFNANVQGPGYSDYTSNASLTTTLLPSTTYNCTVFAGQYSEHYTAWIDYNDDGVFDASERIGYTTTAVAGSGQVGVLGSSASFPISIACNPPAGVHRMRVRCVFGQSSGLNILPCGNVTYGETEDYLITIAPAPTCPAPGLMTAGATTTTTAPLSWPMGCSVATNFDFEYGPVGFTLGTGTSVNNQLVTVSGTTGSYTLTGLTPNTQYSVYYRANCGNGDVSPWSVATNFTTLCAPISLNDPGNAVACDTYTLPVLTEAIASNNTGLTLGYFNAPNGTGGQITGPITSTQQVYAHGAAGSCLTDSVFTVTIYNTPQLFVQNPTICAGDSTVLWLTIGNAIDFVYTLNNNFIGSGITYHVIPTATTTYGISAVGLGGCISAEQQATVTVNQPTTSTSTATSCDSYAWNGQTYTQSGTYTYTTSNALGCDSIATLNLTINNSTTGSETITACDSLVWNGQTYNQSGTYTYLTTNAAGCDSTVTLNLTINNSSSSTTNVTACVSYQWNGQTYTQSGVYTYTTPNAVGCDSVATLNLTINNELFTTENVQTCESSYTWNGQVYTQSGTYTNLSYSVNGCDSTSTLNLTFLIPTISYDTITACNSYQWNGQTYTQSGIYNFTTTNSVGCDSLMYLILTINPSPNLIGGASQSICSGESVQLSVTDGVGGSISWTSNGNLVGTGNSITVSPTVTTSYEVLSVLNGCASDTLTVTVTVDQVVALAFNNGDGTATASTGSSYQWIDCATNTAIAGATNQTYTVPQTGQYSVVVTNANGCSDTSACITVNAVSINELSKLNIQVNPNPSNGIFNLTLNASVEGVILVTDAMGRFVGSQTLNGTSSVIDLSNTVTGIYYLSVKVNGLDKVIRVIKN